MYTSVKTLLFLKFTFISRNVIIYVLTSYVNLMHGSSVKFFFTMLPYEEDIMDASEPY